jgi:surfactin synthase thioesterase subunit
VAAEYARQIEAIQGPGPYLLYAICNGGVLAWETAARLLDGGESIAGILFYEVAFRSETSARSPRPDGTATVKAMPRYEPPPLPVDLTLLMTEGWQSRGRSNGWRQVVQNDLETVVMPGDTPGAHNLYVGREALVAEHVRNWVARSEARLRAT